MARYKPVDRTPRLLPVVLSEQIQPGTFEFALDHLVDQGDRTRPKAPAGQISREQ